MLPTCLTLLTCHRLYRMHMTKRCLADNKNRHFLVMFLIKKEGIPLGCSKAFEEEYSKV